MYFNVQSPVMMGGLFAFPVMKNVWPGAVLSVAIGTLVTIVVLALCRKNVTEEPVKAQTASAEAMPESKPALQTAPVASAEAIDTSDDLDIHIEFE